MSHEEIRMMNGQLKIILTIAIISVLMLPASALAQPCGGYEVTAIIQTDECPPFGYPGIVPFGLNEDGWMVGSFRACVIGPNIAWLWTPDDGLLLIPMPPDTNDSTAVAICGSRIVGRHFISDDEFGAKAFLYDHSSSEFIDLGTLPGGNWSEANDINCAGQITGFWGNNLVGPWQAFLWENGKMMDLGPSIGGTDNRALGINENGAITGWWQQKENGDRIAFLWEDGKVTSLGPILGGFTSVGESVDCANMITGWGLREEGNSPKSVTRAFHWQDGEMLDLGTLPDHLRSGALGMRSSPLEIVGRSWDVLGNPNISHAVLWNDRGLHNLNDLVCGDENLSFKSALAINQSGQIVAQAVDQFNDNVAVLLTPLEAQLGDLDNDCVVSVSDLLVLFSSWGSCENCAWCLADLDQDCTVGVSDLLILFANWG